jgi:hypothetical protein
MMKVFKESHEKNVERLTDDRRCETESQETHALKNDPKNQVVYLYSTEPKVQEVQLLVNTQVR